jgi:hypothetical protein
MICKNSCFPRNDGPGIYRHLGKFRKPTRARCYTRMMEGLRLCPFAYLRDILLANTKIPAFAGLTGWLFIADIGI